MPLKNWHKCLVYQNNMLHESTMPPIWKVKVACAVSLFMCILSCPDCTSLMYGGILIWHKGLACQDNMVCKRTILNISCFHPFSYVLQDFKLIWHKYLACHYDVSSYRTMSLLKGTIYPPLPFLLSSLILDQGSYYRISSRNAFIFASCHLGSFVTLVAALVFSYAC